MTNEAYITNFFYKEEYAAAESFGLSLFIAQDSFMYAIFSADFKKLVELCEVHINGSNLPSFNLKEHIAFLVNNHQLLTRRFAKVYVSMVSREFTLIPKAYAGSTENKSLLTFVTGSDDKATLLQHSFANTTFCFAPEQQTLQFLEKNFTNANIRHSGAVTLSLLFGQHSLKISNLFLVINSSSVEIAARKNNELLFYNLFNYENNEDILYYLLFMMEQFGLSPLDVNLSIASQRKADDELFKTLKKYIKQVNFCVHAPSIELKGDAGRLPSHAYFTLLNQHLCEL